MIAILLAAALMPGPLTDAQVAGALNAHDRAELDVADFMAGATTNGDVRRLAASSVDDHAALEREVAAAASRLSIPAADSPLAASARRDALAELDKLKQKSGPALDEIYLDDSAAAERAWLEALDRDLAPSAGRPEVRALVERARRLGTRRLDQTRRLQQKLHSP